MEACGATEKRVRRRRRSVDVTVSSPTVSRRMRYAPTATRPSRPVRASVTATIRVRRRHRPRLDLHGCGEPSAAVAIPPARCRSEITMRRAAAPAASVDAAPSSAVVACRALAGRDRVELRAGVGCRSGRGDHRGAVVERDHRDLLAEPRLVDGGAAPAPRAARRRRARPCCTTRSIADDPQRQLRRSARARTDARTRPPAAAAPRPARPAAPGRAAAAALRPLDRRTLQQPDRTEPHLGRDVAAQQVQHDRHRDREAAEQEERDRGTTCAYFLAGSAPRDTSTSAKSSGFDVSSGT